MAGSMCAEGRSLRSFAVALKVPLTTVEADAHEAAPGEQHVVEWGDPGEARGPGDAEPPWWEYFRLASSASQNARQPASASADRYLAERSD